MDNLHKLIVKSAIFHERGASWVMIDLLRLFDEEMTGESSKEEFYLHYIQKLKHKYDREIQSLLDKKENIIQKDLETEIKELDEERRTQE